MSLARRARAVKYYRHGVSTVGHTMKTRAEKHLARLRREDKVHHLQAALLAHLTDPQDLDLRMTLVGAMQHAGWKERQVRPYLDEWNVDVESCSGVGWSGF